MKLLHNILRGSTLATALFIFQACYGMPQDYSEPFYYEATVKVTDSNGKALEGVSVSVRNALMTEFADHASSAADGTLEIYASVPKDNPSLELRFEAEGYAVKDTSIENVTDTEPDFKIKLVPLK